jgi:hypothetical protein
MEIIVTEEIYERMDGVHSFVPVAGIQIKGKGTVKAWRLTD